jgi:hypothetical protein
MAFDFEEECRQFQVNKNLTKKLDAKLFPLLEKATAIKTFDMLVLPKLQETYNTSLSNLIVFENLLRKIKSQVDLEPKEIAMLFVVDYLIVTESLLTHGVDFITFALISSGKTLTNPRTNQAVVLPDEIKLVPLGTKLDFLRKNGFSIISNRCSVQLRNSAGHLNYKVDTAGNVTLPKGTIIKIFTGMTETQDKLRDAAIGTHIAIRHFYYEKYGKYAP